YSSGTDFFADTDGTVIQYCRYFTAVGDFLFGRYHARQFTVLPKYSSYSPAVMQYGGKTKV
ncbi:MAG: hypothetical protein ABJQ90_18760, partial [Parasphingorhabdus sp.]